MAEISELWELVGPSWRLPLRIVWHDDFGEVIFPIHLLNVQRFALDKVIHQYLYERAGKLWICRADLTKVAHRSDHTDPEDIVEWLPAARKVKVDSFQENNFIEGYCSSPFAIHRDPSIMDTIWASFCKYMLHRFINDEKEISFGFMRLVPILARKHWFNVVAKFEHAQFKKHAIFKSEFLNPDPQSIIDRGVADHMTGVMITSFDPVNNVPRPTIEVVLNEEFFQASLKKELARKRAWRPQKYWWQYLERLKRQLGLVMELYAENLKEAQHPYCGINKSSFVGRNRKQPAAAIGPTAREASGPWGEADVLFPRVEPAQQSGVVHETNGNVPAVPDLLPQERDVRANGSDVDE